MKVLFLVLWTLLQFSVVFPTNSSATPSYSPSPTPSAVPSSASPSQAPSQSPSASPSQAPSQIPTASPSQIPSRTPTASPSQSPSTASPSQALSTASPTTAPHLPTQLQVLQLEGPPFLQRSIHHTRQQWSRLWYLLICPHMHLPRLLLMFHLLCQLLVRADDRRLHHQKVHLRIPHLLLRNIQAVIQLHYHLSDLLWLHRVFILRRNQQEPLRASLHLSPHVSRMQDPLGSHPLSQVNSPQFNRQIPRPSQLTDLLVNQVRNRQLFRPTLPQSLPCSHLVDLL